MENVLFWLPILISIPLGVAVNLITPLVVQKLGKVNTRLRAAVKRRKESEDLLIGWLVKDSNLLTVYVTEQNAHLLSLAIVMAIGFTSSAVAIATTREIFDTNWFASTAFLLFSISIGPSLSGSLHKKHRILRAVYVANGWPDWNGKVYFEDGTSAYVSEIRNRVDASLNNSDPSKVEATGE